MAHTCVRLIGLGIGTFQPVVVATGIIVSPVTDATTIVNDVNLAAHHELDGGEVVLDVEQVCFRRAILERI